MQDPDVGKGFVPQVAMLGAIGLALLGAAFLIYFINHVAVSIQDSTIIARISRQTVAELRAMERREKTSSRSPEWWLRAVVTSPVTTRRSGYVSAIDLTAIGRLAASHAARIRVEVQSGAFVVEGEPLLALVDEGDGDLSDETGAALRETIAIAASRDIKLDPAFGVRQLVDIALRALSPGVNDTTTAVICVDYLTPVLVAADAHARPYSVWVDEDDVERAFVRSTGFADLLDQAFAQIMVSGAQNLAVLSRQSASLRHLEQLIDDPDRRALLAQHLDQIAERGAANLPSAHERLPLAGLAGELGRGLSGE